LDPKKSFTLKLGPRDEEKLIALERVTDSGANNRLAMYAYTIAFLFDEPATGKALPAPSIKSTALFVNDEYLGCYNWIEIYSEADLYDHYQGKNAELFKALFDEMGEDQPLNHLCEKKFPDDSDFTTLNTLIYNAKSMDAADWSEWVAANVDIEDVVTYLVVHNYLGVHDTSRLNFYIYNYGKILILPWDNENSFNLTGQSLDGNNLLTRRLLEIPTIRADYNSEMQRLFLCDATSDLSSDPRIDLTNPESTGNIVDDLVTEAQSIFAEIDSAMYHDPTFYITYDMFLSKQSELLYFLYNRSAEIPEIPLP
jgi:hypothetical protein